MADTVYIGVKNNFKRAKLIRLLAAVVAATKVPPNFLYMPEKEANDLATADASLVEVNPAAKDDKGNVAVRATAAGITASDANPVPAAKASTPATPFTIEDNVPVPEVRRGGQKADIYPFDKLSVGQSFFVPATDKRPAPAKSLASTVSSANKRYAEKTGEQETVTVKGKTVTREKLKFTRLFTVRAQDGGARIWRTA